MGQVISDRVIIIRVLLVWRMALPLPDKLSTIPRMEVSLRLPQRLSSTKKVDCPFLGIQHSTYRVALDTRARNKNDTR
jgi:hypothetical protein